MKGTDRDDNNLLELSQQRRTERTSGNGEDKGEASPVETYTKRERLKEKGGNADRTKNKMSCGAFWDQLPLGGKKMHSLDYCLVFCCITLVDNGEVTDCCLG